jgi:hypothetical protein
VRAVAVAHRAGAHGLVLTQSQGWKLVYSGGCRHIIGGGYGSSTRTELPPLLPHTCTFAPRFVARYASAHIQPGLDAGFYSGAAYCMYQITCITQYCAMPLFCQLPLFERLRFPAGEQAA